MLDSPGFNQLTRGRDGYYLYNRNDIFVGRALERYGEYGRLEAQVIAQLCAPGSVVIDAGANIGTHTLMLARHVGPSGFVFAFEPQRVVFQTLCANMALNSITNVECVHAALGAEPGTVFVPPFDYDSEGNYGSFSAEAFSEGWPVRRTTLDEYAGFPIRLMKIDVEGMEEAVLAGGRELIERRRPFLYIENDRQDKSERLIRALWDLRYRLFWHTPALYNPENFQGDPVNIYEHVVSVNILGMPEEQRGKITGFEEVTDATYHPMRR